MKRYIKFLLGLVLGFLIVYLIRRLLVGENQPPAPEVPTKTPPTPSQEETTTSTYTGRFTVRTNGPRPQAPVVPAETPVEEAEISTAETPALAEASSGEQISTNQEFDFLIIKDIGPVSNKRLLEAGVKSFAALAAMPVEEIAQITKLPAARITQNRWREQSARLAEGLPLEETETPTSSNE